MSTIEKIAAIMFGLIMVYLIVTSRGNFNTVVTAIGGAVTKTTRTLQGRE